jgi:hypothetical protein
MAVSNGFTQAGGYSNRPFRMAVEWLKFAVTATSAPHPERVSWDASIALAGRELSAIAEAVMN